MTMAGKKTSKSSKTDHVLNLISGISTNQEESSPAEEKNAARTSPEKAAPAKETVSKEPPAKEPAVEPGSAETPSQAAPAPYRARSVCPLEADASSASYFLALGALAGGPVTVTGVGEGSLQGDVAFADVLERMGAEVTKTADSITVRRPAGVAPTGVDVDCTAIPDAAMTLVPMALCATGAVRLTGIASWRVKETDRIKAMTTEMRKFGAVVEEGEDWILAAHPVDGVRDAVVETYDDHRMAMSLALAAAAGAGVTVLGPGCTAKTFPNFFEAFESLCRRDRAPHG